VTPDQARTQNQIDHADGFQKKLHFKLMTTDSFLLVPGEGLQMAQRRLLVRATLITLFCVLFAWVVQAQTPADVSGQASTATEDSVTEYQLDLHNSNRSRVASGSPAAPGQLPWQAALVSMGWPPRYNTFCGGTVVGTRWVITAAHCFPEGSTEKRQYIFVGPVDLKNDEAGQHISISHIYVHPDFNWGTLDNDIALLYLSENVRKEMASPVDLLQLQDEGAAEAQQRTGWVSGWGQTGESQQKSDYLKFANVEFQDRKKCAENYRRNNRTSIITANMICAGSDQSDKGDACFGDSGGPLIVPHDKDYRLAGAVSWGTGCSRAGLYGVYTRIPVFVDWIDKYRRLTESQLPPSTPIKGPLFKSIKYRSTPVEGEQALAERPEWQDHIDWSIRNYETFGATNCPEQYPYPGCVLQGGRSCLMNYAIEQAKDNSCTEAFKTTLVTQCHNTEALASIKQAGERRVCSYLKSVRDTLSLPSKPTVKSEPQDPTLRRAQGKIYCEANPGGHACHEAGELTITLEPGYAIDDSFEQKSLPCCGGDENKNHDTTKIPAGIYMEFTGRADGEWGVFKVRLVADTSSADEKGAVRTWKILADSYCGPSGAFGKGMCNVHADAWVKVKKIQ
jgi:V8-like Glu-specific endopeptidase